ncbi:MAG: NEW3 domain-containing protein [Acidimicrobiia bacterium]
MKLRKIWLAALGLLLILAPATAAWSQEAEPVQTRSIDIITPFSGVAVEPGQSANFNLDITGPPGERVELTTSGAPSEWTVQLKGGGLVVSEVILPEPDENGVQDINLRLEVDVPQETAEGSYDIRVTGTSSAGSDTLDLSIEVAAAIGGGVSLTSEFPALRGPADVTFTYTLELENDTSEEIQFGLQTTGPPGWQIEARPAGQSRASTVTLGPGDSSRITVDVDPNDLTPAGLYSVLVGAAGGGQTTEAELFTEITGNFALELTTSDQRLNLTATAGEASDLTLIVVNTGTAPLLDVQVSSTPPRGWEVTFAPESVPEIEPNGGFAEVVATVTPAGDAVAGDYRISFDARVPEARDSIEVRATVETSLFWGFVGIAVIVAALAALLWVFRRYGRR